MKKIFKKIKNWFHGLVDRKKYLEIISAFLTIPMLITVIIVNTNNIKNQKNSQTSSSGTTPIQVVITGTQEEKLPPKKENLPSGTITPTTIPTSTPTPTSTSCLQEIGPIEITSPQEGEIITTNNVCLNISTSSKYCPLVWSYKLNNDDWSDFSNNNICLYNLSSGKKQLQVKFKNSTTGQTITIARNFTFQSNSTTPTTTPTLTLTPTPTP